MIIVLFVAAVIFSFISWKNVHILRDLKDFLPDKLNSIIGQKVLEQSFGSSSSGIIYIKDESNRIIINNLVTTLRSYDEIKSIFSPDSLGLFTVPKQFLPEKVRSIFYPSKGMILTLEFKYPDNDPRTNAAIERIMDYIEDKPSIIFTGYSVLNWEASKSQVSTIQWYFILSLILMYFILISSTKSYLTPFFFFISMLFAYVINMGTNTVFGSISYFTNNLAAALQFGVSMDYSIFLLHRIEEEVAKTNDLHKAIASGINKTFSAILGSSITSVIGFAAIAIMTLSFGYDLGLVVAKGVFISLIASTTLLPSIICIFFPIMHKYRFHFKIKRNYAIYIPKIMKKPFVIRPFHAFKVYLQTYTDPIKIKKIFRIFLIALPILILCAVYIPIDYQLEDVYPSYLTSLKNLHVVQKLAKQTDMIYMLLPAKDIKTFNRYQLKIVTDEIQEYKGVTTIISINDLTSSTAPFEFIPKEIISSFYRNDYVLVFINLGVSIGSEMSIDLVQKIRTLIRKHYERFYLVGQSLIVADFINIAKNDFVRLNFGSIILIIVILFLLNLSFKYPFILLIVIESAIGLNYLVYFLLNGKVPFIGNMIIGSIQLGATIDYALLFISRYIAEYQLSHDKLHAIRKTMLYTFEPIATAALCLFSATLGFALFDPVGLVRGISTLIGRGAILSFIIVVAFLSPVTYIFSSIFIRSNETRSRFYEIFKK